MKRCAKCKTVKPSDAFAFRKRSRDRRQSYCRDCQHVEYAAYYRLEGSAFRQRLVARKLQQRALNRAYLAQYLACHPCVDCGIADPLVLEFDHVNGTKRAAIARLVVDAALSTMQAEIAKCVVRCANCHRRRTARSWRHSARVAGRKTLDDHPSIGGSPHGDCSSVG